MIIVKTPEQIKLMRIAGRITGEALLLGGEMVKPGVSTKQIDDKIRHYIEKCGAKPSFLGYGGFPGSACISINQEIIHGIPSSHRIIEEGDIVKIDVGATFHGFVGERTYTASTETARTPSPAETSPKKQKSSSRSQREAGNSEQRLPAKKVRV